jgi:uncharacterized protein involved in outer membrane biogenesis
MKKVLIAVGVLILIVVAAVILLVSNIDTIIKKGVETVGPKILQAPVTLKDVDISVSSSSGELSGLTIGNPAGYNTEYAFQLGRIAVELDVKSVTSDKVHIRRVLIDSPQITYEGALGKKNNLSQLQANVESFTGGSGGKDEKTDSRDSGAGKKVQIDYLKIADGSISVSMDVLQGKELTVTLPTIELRDIGKDKEVTMSDALKQVLSAVNNVTLPAVRGAVTNFTKGLKGTAEAVQEGAQEGLDKLKGLFGK